MNALKLIFGKLTVLFLLAAPAVVSAQTNGGLSLDSCYSKAKRNYPMVKQFGLIEKTRIYSIENISKGYLPQVNVGGHATYQSEVTQPVFSNNLSGNAPLFETLSKDQYKIYGELLQPITDLFTLNNQRELAEKNAQLEIQKLEVELFKLHDRIDQIFFGILLMDEQIVQAAIFKKDIQAGVDKTTAALANGTALKSNLYLLQAELLKLDQKIIELKAARRSYSDMLGLFIGETVSESTLILKPEIPVFSTEINRPEIRMFDTQKQVFTVLEDILYARNLPRFSLFLQSGIGRPALNMLSNDFNFYYIGGLRLNWNLAGLYTFKREKDILALNAKTIDIQKETFLFNTALTVKQQSNEVAKIKSLIESDKEIIELREKIKVTAQSQLLNGVISASDYVSYVNAEHQARQNLLLHNIQLLMVLHNNQTTTGY